MAEEEKDEKESKEEKKKGGSKTLIIIIVVVVLLLGGGGAAFFILGKDKKGEGEEDVAADEHEEGQHADSQPAILPLDTFIVNLQVKGSFLKTAIQLEFAQPEVPKAVEHDTPKIRDTIIRILSAKNAQDILTSDGKESLRQEIKKSINEVLKSEDITNVYLTEFIIQ
ncbi:MAG: flagellar basal body-associated FliL family protein [Proteobacteria bacterium]|nr:flagellar basal body-associated FliL family protein [Pseudomonadota bacterium]